MSELDFVRLMHALIFSRKIKLKKTSAKSLTFSFPVK